MHNDDHNNQTIDYQTPDFTLANLRNYLLECDLPAAEVAQLRSAVKRADELVGHGLLDLPANPRLIFDRLKRFSPAMAGMTEQSFANMKSRLRKAFRYAQPHLVNPRSRFPLTGDWGALQSTLDVKTQRATSRLFHFTARLGVLPRHMSDAVIERFVTHLRDEAMVVQWEAVAQDSIKAWNRLAAANDDLPQLTPLPVKRTSYWIAESEWNPSLVAERDAFLQWLASPSCFETRRHKSLKPGTIAQYGYNITIAVSALVHSGISKSALAHLFDVVRPGHVDLALRFLAERSGGKVTPQMFQLAFRLRTVARWCNLPSEDLGRLDQIVCNVRDQRDRNRGMTPKNKALLDRLEDPQFRDLVHLLPFTILERAQKNPAKAWAPALARTAVAIELLLVCSVRRANLVGLELDRSIRKIGQGKETFWIVEHDAGEVKNEEPLRFHLPDQTTAMLESYLTEWRPKLCAKPNPWLFPAANGSCIKPKAMAHAITTQSKRILGVAITPHQFRHISAELFLQENPEALFTISQHLGHRDVNTTRRYYARSKQRQASRHYQETILRSRETARIRIKRTKRPKDEDSNSNEPEDRL